MKYCRNPIVILPQFSIVRMSPLKQLIDRLIVPNPKLRKNP